MTSRNGYSDQCCVGGRGIGTPIEGRIGGYSGMTSERVRRDVLLLQGEFEEVRPHESTHECGGDVVGMAFDHQRVVQQSIFTQLAAGPIRFRAKDLLRQRHRTNLARDQRVPRYAP